MSFRNVPAAAGADAAPPMPRPPYDAHRNPWQPSGLDELMTFVMHWLPILAHRAQPAQYAPGSVPPPPDRTSFSGHLRRKAQVKSLHEDFINAVLSPIAMWQGAAVEAFKAWSRKSALLQGYEVGEQIRMAEEALAMSRKNHAAAERERKRKRAREEEQVFADMRQQAMLAGNAQVYIETAKRLAAAPPQAMLAAAAAAAEAAGYVVVHEDAAPPAYDAPAPMFAQQLVARRPAAAARVAPLDARMSAVQIEDVDDDPEDEDFVDEAVHNRDSAGEDSEYDEYIEVSGPRNQADRDFIVDDGVDVD